MTTFTKRAALLAAVGVLTVGTLAACTNVPETSTPSRDRNTTSVTSGVNPHASAVGAAGDIMFAQMMIPHHQQAIEMADIALSKPSASTKVKDLAVNIKKAQDPEIATMRGWLTSWGAPSSAPSGMDHGTGMMSAADMDKLKTSDGADFDRSWITMMISHHQGAVTMAEQVLSTTQNAAVKKLAEAIITAQKAEITTMQGLL